MAPPTIHDDQSDYPAFPENACIAFSQLSPLQRRTAPIQPSKKAPDPAGERKLIPSLTPKQKAWLKPFVDYCIGQRQRASTDFERDFWKLLGNSVFGKTMEDVRSYTQVSVEAGRR